MCNSQKKSYTLQHRINSDFYIYLVSFFIIFNKLVINNIYITYILCKKNYKIYKNVKIKITLPFFPQTL